MLTKVIIFLVFSTLIFIGSDVFAVPAGQIVTWDGGGYGMVKFEGDEHAEKGYNCDSCHPSLLVLRLRDLLLGGLLLHRRLGDSGDPLHLAVEPGVEPLTRLVLLRGDGSGVVVHDGEQTLCILRRELELELEIHARRFQGRPPRWRVKCGQQVAPLLLLSPLGGPSFSGSSASDGVGELRRADHHEDEEGDEVLVEELDGGHAWTCSGRAARRHSLQVTSLMSLTMLSMRGLFGLHFQAESLSFAGRCLWETFFFMTRRSLPQEDARREEKM